jgi:sugar (pentulose or hexulose) kinase
MVKDDTELKPNAAHTKAYARFNKVYRDLYPALKASFGELAKL